MKAFLGYVVTLCLWCNLASALPVIQQWETSNGAQVYFVQAMELPMVDVSVTFDAGSARDAAKSGLARLTNSVLDEGAGGHSADQIAEQFESLGAQYSNSAGQDMANVSLRSLNDAQLLQPAIELVALLLAKPDFDEKSFTRIREQMLMGLKAQQQSPGSIANRAFYSALFGHHPYAMLTSGTPETVAALTREDVKAFHARYYVAKNAVIAIVGALDKKTAETLANTVIGQLPKGETAHELPIVTELTATKNITIAHPTTQTHIYVGQPLVTRTDPDYFTLYVGNHILGGNALISRIAEEIREKRGLAYSAYSSLSPLRKAGPFMANMQTRNDQTTQALQLLRDTLQRFVEQGVTEQELTDAKKNITGGFPLKIDSNGEIVSYLATIGFYHLPLDYLNTFMQKIEAVTVNMIKETFKRRLQLDKLVTVTVGGESNSNGQAAKPPVQNSQ